MAPAPASETHKWCLDSLEKFTGYATSNDVVNYILSITDEEELRDFLNGILAPLNAEKRSFMDELVKKINFSHRQKQQDAGLSVESYRLYQKPQIVEETFDKQKNKKSTRNKRNQQDARQIDSNRAEDELVQKEPNKGPKYVPLFDPSGKQSVILLPGRHECDCQATRHKLIRNCLSCGRIVCEQERAGPCLFCGDFVATREEMEVMKRVSQKGKKIYEKIMRVHNTYLQSQDFDPVSPELPETGPPIGGFRKDSRIGVNPKQSETLQSITASLRDTRLDQEDEKSLSQESKAVDFKNRLLNYDRTSSKRTQVIDDESDYFGADLWQSPEERIRLQEQEKRLREQKKIDERKRTVTIDVMGKKVLESVNNLSVYERAKMEDEASKIAKKSFEARESQLLSASSFPIVDSRGCIQAPTFVQTEFSDDTLKQNYLQAAKDNLSKGLKLQDSFLQEMTDQGLCLSMHQPWASLLVAGIKRFEGRDWYTTHRGRLWIASTAKACPREEIDQLEQTYKILRNDDQITFPVDYPTGCLLGCVDVIDCLTQEQYMQQFSFSSESGIECSDSSYVWVCENPHELHFKFPVIGQPKIWKLEAEKHKAAKKTLKF